MAYKNFQNCTEQEYHDIIYSGEAEQSLKLWVNDVEIENIEDYCEEITRISRVFPNGSNTFNINELVSQEVQIVVHELNPNIFNGTIKFSIGTLIDEENEIYEYVPMGVFNIQETPTTDYDKTTLTLRDNSVKLDVPYNAKPLIDLNNGSATLKQILLDICTNCGISTKITTFFGENKLIGIYDNTINARIYINYIAGQCGAIPVIDRDGELDFVYVNNLTTHKIPLDVVESYELGTPYQIEKVLFESGIIKYEKTILPNEYTEVDYLETNATGYINTGYKAKSTTTYEIIAQLNHEQKLDGALFGSRTSAGNENEFILWHNNNNLITTENISARVGGANVTKYIPNSDFEWRKIEYRSDNYFYINDEQIGLFNNQQSDNNTLNLYLLGMNTNGNVDARKFRGKVKNFKIWENNVLVRNFVPCYRNSDSKVGFYDVVNNVFYTNQENGNFTYGEIKQQTTMYIDSANLYINEQAQIDNIFNVVNGFKIDSVTTGNILGNPAIDPWDLIQIYGYYDENNNFISDENTIVFTTFANKRLTYSGVSTDVFETTISEEKRDSNVSLSSNATYKKNVKTEIDLINGILRLINEEYLNFLKETSGTGYVEIENVYANGITRIEITGIMSALFPSNTLYPSDTLYAKSPYLIVEDSNQNKKYYDLGINYLATGDKYIYNYEFDDTQNTYVATAIIKRNNNTEEELQAPIFEIPKGDYKIYMECCNNLQYQVQYVIYNDLTSTMATNTQLATAITQTRNEIDIKASQQVNKDEIIADLNVAIKDGKGVINLTGNQVVINSDNFKVSGDGTINAKNGIFEGTINGSTINGARISIVDDFRATSLQELYDNPSFHVTSYETYDGADHQNNLYLTGGMIEMRDDMGGLVKMGVGTGVGEIVVYGNVIADDFVRTSLEEKKKNFEKFNNALKIIKNTDIYKYHYKNKNDNTKKDIGIVIGEKYKYSKELTNEDNTGMNLTNMVGVCFQAIKEQQEMIEKLQKEIKKLKEAK